MLMVFRYIRYLFRAKTKHGIHSPFVFELVTRVLNDQKQHAEYQQVESLRKQLLRNGNTIEVIDFGARKGNSGYSTYFRKVNEIARRAAIPVKYGRLLLRLIKYYKPRTMLELGSSVGISTMYQAMGNPVARFTSVEGCATTAEYAINNIKMLGLPNTRFVIGNFDVVLNEALSGFESLDYAFIDGNHTSEATMRYFNAIVELAGNDSVYIIHDIHWSPDMETAWQQICRHPSVKVTIDLFYMGLVFFRKEMSAEHFIIRF